MATVLDDEEALGWVEPLSDRLRDGTVSISPGIPSERKIALRLEFPATVGVQVRENEDLKWKKMMVTFSEIDSLLVLRMISTRNGERHVSKTTTTFPARTCRRITDLDKLKGIGSLAAHFEKHMSDSSTEKTKFVVVSLRAWPKQKQAEIERLWTFLNVHAAFAAKKELNGSSGPVPIGHATAGKKDVRGRAKAFKGPEKSAIPLSLRQKERDRFVGIPSGPSQGVRGASVSAYGNKGMKQGSRLRQAMENQRRGQARSKYTSMGQTPQASSESFRSSFSLSLVGEAPGAAARKGLSAPRRVARMLRRSDVRGSQRANLDESEGWHSSSQRPPPTHLNDQGKRSAKEIISGAGTVAEAKKRARVTPDGHSNQDSADTNVTCPSGQELSAAQEKLREHVYTQRQVVPDRSVATLCRAGPVASQRSSPSNAVGVSSVLQRRSGGISNAGNTCYLAAAMQALLSDRSFIQLLKSQAPTFRQAEAPFAHAILNMAQDRSSDSPLDPGQVRSAISLHFPEFASSEQQDAHEFITRCFDVLEGEMSRHGFNKCPVTQGFSLLEQKLLRCKTCGHTTKPQPELFRSLSLSMPDSNESCVANDNNRTPANLQDLLHEFFAAQNVDLKCQECSAGSAAQSTSEVSLAPRVLVLHLKRFRVQSNGIEGVSLEKVSDPVLVPETLNLDGNLATNALGPTALLCKSPLSANGVAPEKRHGDGPPASLSAARGMTGSRGHPCTTRVTPPRIDDPTVFEDVIDLAGNSSLGDTCGLTQLEPVCSPKATQNVIGSRRCRVRALPAPSVSVPPPGAKRFRVHSPPGAPRARAETPSSHAPLENIPSVCRSLDMSGSDFVDEFPDETQRVEENLPVSLEGNQRIEKIDAFLPIGISHEDAVSALREENYNIVRAVGKALDRQHDERPAKSAAAAVTAQVSALQADMAVVPDCARASGITYRLSAAIRHCSNSAEHGHYQADIRQPDGSWLCYDDSVVSAVDRKVDRERNGYMFWYIAEMH